MTVAAANDVAAYTRHMSAGAAASDSSSHRGTMASPCHAAVGGLTNVRFEMDGDDDDDDESEDAEEAEEEEDDNDAWSPLLAYKSTDAGSSDGDDEAEAGDEDENDECPNASATSRAHSDCSAALPNTDASDA